MGHPAVSSRRRFALALTITALSAGALAACLDTTPVYVAEQASTKGDASFHPVLLDAGREAEAAVVHDECVACLEAPDTPGPGCKSTIDTCDTLDRCKVSYLCAVNSGCFAVTSLADFYACGLACANEAGVVSFDDPAISYEYGIFQCGLTTCKDVCKFGKDQGGGQ